MKLKYILTPLSLMIVLNFVSCANSSIADENALANNGSNVNNSVGSVKSEESFKDDIAAKMENLENITSISDITTEMIKNGEIGFDIKNSKNSFGNNTFKQSFSYLTGVENVLRINAQEESVVTINYSTELEKGEAKIYILLSDGNLIELPNESYGEFYYTLTEGENKIMVVGYEAAGELEINVSGSNLIDVSTDLVNIYK